jgi:RES domain-containing protein
MKPLPDRASEGRVNPKGIPCLYCSTDKKTAMTETRPWIGSYVTVAQFEVLKDLRLVDCTADLPATRLMDLSYESNRDKWEEYVWGCINRAFSEPVARNDDVADYAPTQVLAEGFRSVDYDGIQYGSILGEGKSVALFDLTAAKPIDCDLYLVEDINLTYSWVPEL